METNALQRTSAGTTTGPAALGSRVGRAAVTDGLPTSATGLVRYFTRVWKWHALPVVRRGLDPRLVIPNGPWGPGATVWFNQRWVRWGAITTGRHVFLASGGVSAGLLAHEYTHVLQTEAAGGFRPYLQAWAVLTARYGYRQNPLEVEGYPAPAALKQRLAEFGARDDRTYGPGDTWHPAHETEGPNGLMLTYAGVQYASPSGET
jgi:hypothetical protein